MACGHFCAARWHTSGVYCLYVSCRLVSEILRESGDATEVELTRDGQWHVTKTEDLDCPSPEPTFVQNIIDSELTFCVVVERVFVALMLLVGQRMAFSG